MRLVPDALGVIFVGLTVVTMAGQQPQGPQPPQPPSGGGRGFGGGGGRGQFQVPPRDTQPAPTGTARIRGRIISADSGAALRRAQVRLASQDVRNAKTATTDTEGRFEFSELPAGRYTLTVSKAGYLTLQYGQRRPLEPGKPIELSNGQVLDRTDVALPRGGVVTGRILDEYGEPLADATVMALRYQYVGGQRQLVPSGRSAQTDDIGQFRIFGLPPGDYYISATTRTPMAAIQAATAAVAVAPPQGAAGPFELVAGAAGMQAVRDALGAGEDERTGYAPTYYPGTPTLSDAQRVTVGIGEELPGLGFSMTVAKLARISGTVVDSQGQALARGMVAIRPARGGPMFFRGGPNGSAVNAGVFTVNGVAPGDYVLQVRTGGPGGRGFGGGPGGPDQEFANASVSVNGGDIDDLIIVTSKGATVRGRLTFGSNQPPGDLSRIGISAVSTSDQGPIAGGGSTSRSVNGSFELRGLTGPTLFRVAGAPSGWTLKAVRLDGADITDTPHEFKGGETVAGLEIELTSKPTRIDGTVTDNQRHPIRDYAVVVFSEESDHWMPQSRFVRAGRPDQDGKFQIIGLPPGRYLAVALEYLEQGSEMDPDLLEQLKLKATSLSLDEGETRQLDLKLSL
jgi:Carboxypeptidase regulatory-like domain